jgi:phosphoglycerate dehydrogenase-like enzyme
MAASPHNDASVYRREFREAAADCCKECDGKGLVGEAELRVMKSSARLINTSRGPIVDEPALIDVLRQRRIAGAALDVFDIEPLPADHPFRSLDNVLATPHIGFVARELYRRFYGDTVKNILGWLAQQ